MITHSEPGAPTAAGFLPLAVPTIDGNEWNYVKECLITGWVSSVGPFVDRFETELARYVGARYAVATTSGTAALHVALRVAGVEPDDEVLVPSLTFIAPANAVRYLGAWPVFVDAEPRHWQMDVEVVGEFLSSGCDRHMGELRNRHTGRRVRAILPVHVLGHPCDMDPLMQLANEYELAVIEDATESLGGEYRGKKLGTMGNLGCFSFNGNKLITTGGGGMIVSNDEGVASKARYLTTQAKDDPIEYVHNEVGYNYRLTNVQAAIGCAQLERISEHLENKRETAAVYQRTLEGVAGIDVMTEATWAKSACWLTTILVNESAYGIDRRALMDYLHHEKVQSRPLWQPMHLSPAHRDGVNLGCPVAEQIWRDALSLPSSMGIEEAQIDRVAQLIKGFARRSY
jgi:perosamine synthetase